MYNNEMTTGENRTCLAEGCVYPTEQSKTGINPNELIVGPTRSGKTMSVVIPRLLHTFDGSLIVSITKRELFDEFAPLFRERGYRVWDLNLAEPDKSGVAYDPLRNISTDREVAQFAHTIMDTEGSVSKDLYWEMSAESALTALTWMIVDDAKLRGKKPRFADLCALVSMLELYQNTETASTSLDFLFERKEKNSPGNMGSRTWKTLQLNAPRTTACIFSTMNACADKVMVPEVVKMTKSKPAISFRRMAERKTVLFVTTSPVNKSMEKYATMFYADAFRELFEYAQSRPEKTLPLPVHIIYDDFATGSRIPDFQEYLSVICAMGLSTTLLLQSESQLEGMYGRSAATTIINNCDTYVYLGGMDDLTCANISRRSNRPLDEIYSMPLEKVYVFRRGARPVFARRYQTLEDPLYRQLKSGKEKEERQEKEKEQTP